MVCVCAYSSYIIPFKNRKHDLSVVSVIFFLGEEKRNCRLRRKEETHTHRFFLDEEKEKARGKIVMWVVVQNASFVFIINFFVRRAEWAYSQRSLSVFNSLPTLHTHKDVYRLSPSLVTVVRCLVVKKKTGEIERKQIFFWGAGGRARQEENLPSVVRRFSLICVTWSSFDEIDSSVVLLVRQVSTRRRACQPEHAVKHQQINSES